MKLEKLKDRPLSESEQILKKAFLMGDGRYWEEPMTYSAYENGCREGFLTQTPMSGHLKEHTLDQRGVTNCEFDRDGEAGIVLHERYGYPVLHNHDYVEIIYVASGSCINCFEGFSFDMREGDVCILSPNAFHAVSCTRDDACVVNLLVGFKFFGQKFLDLLKGGKLVADFLERVLYKRAASPYILFRTEQDEWLQTLAVRMVSEEMNKPKAYTYSISLLASEFLLHISREYEMMAIVPNPQSDTQNSLIVAILGYLSVNYNRTTLGETAAFFGYSEAYLSRLIRENTGKNFSRIITELQMQKAVELFQSREVNLAQIAQAVGCFDSSHFNKKFRSVYGVSPGKYLKEMFEPQTPDNDKE